MVIVSCWTIAFFFGNLLECIPISRAWAHVVGGYPDPRCIDAVVLYLAQAWIDVFLDLIILLIPIPLSEYSLLLENTIAANLNQYGNCKCRSGAVLQLSVSS